LKDSQWRKVLRDLQRGAQSFGYKDERWTLDRIQRLIADRHGVSYNANYLSEKLRKSSWSVQQSVRVARERKEALVRQWLQEHWPRIKKFSPVADSIVSAMLAPPTRATISRK
jgi:transposase